MNKTEKALVSALHASVPKRNYTKMEQTIQNTHTMPIAPSRISPFEMFIRLLRFISWKIWLVQGIFLIGFCRGLINIAGLDLGFSPGITIRLICLICGSIPFITIPFLHRSMQYKMQEIEMASYLSFSMQMLTRLLSIAIGNICMLASGVIISIYVMHMPLMASMVYWMTPFLIFSTLILVILTHVSANRAITFYGVSYLGLLILTEVISHIHTMVEKSAGAHIMLLICGGLFVTILLQTKKLVSNHQINELHLSESY